MFASQDIIKYFEKKKIFDGIISSEIEAVIDKLLECNSSKNFPSGVFYKEGKKYQANNDKRLFADINMTYNLSRYPPIKWAFYTMLTFLILQGSSALFGINYYAAITFKDEYVKRGIILLFSPILVLMFDSLMIFYRPFENYLPDQLVIFMVQYENLRKISEIMLETIPQTILQISLFFVCAEKICGFNAEEEVST